MKSRPQRKTLFSILLIMGIAIAGCTGITPVTPTLISPTGTKRPSAMPTITRTATPDYVATTDFIETASIGMIISTSQPVTLASYPSKDGKWRVEILRYDCANYSYQDHVGSVAYEQLKLINLSDGTENIVDDQRQECGGVGAFGLGGLHWSPSNRYFYYNDSREGYPDGCGNYLALPAYRLDTVTHEVLMLAGGLLTPDKAKLAFWEGHDIVIWDLDKGEIGRVSPLKSNLFNGEMWWSFDSQRLIYLQTEFQCAPDLGKSYMTSLDLTDYSQTAGGEYETTSTEIAATPVPSGVFVLSFYAPLIMNYDTSLWTDESIYTIRNFLMNYLQAMNLTSCSIGVQGPTDFNGPHTSEIVRLGKLRFEVLSFPASLRDFVNKTYLADQSLATDYGLPVFWVSAIPDEWDECKKMAEEVLSTLRFPLK